jgi:hypothetical protein
MLVNSVEDRIIAAMRSPVCKTTESASTAR